MIMTAHEFFRIRTDAGLSLTQLGGVLRVSDTRSLQRWESGEKPVSGPVSVIMRLIEADQLPARYRDPATPV